MKEKENTKPNQQFIQEKLIFHKTLTEEERISEAARLKSEIDAVDIDTAFFHVKSRLRQNNRIIVLKNQVIRFAAVLTLPLLIFTIWNLYNMQLSSKQTESIITWQEIESPAGMRSFLKLPDGTDMWLNAGSKVKYSIPFTRESRHLELTGEAYLQVAKNPNSPFIVEAQNTMVQVLGTQFNVKAYPDENNVEIALKEGKVEFYYSKDTGKNLYTKLEVNDLVVLNKKNRTITRENGNIESYIAWHKNLLVFDDTPMIEVASKLEKWYGVRVVIADDEILKYKFTTTFANEPLFRVLELLELSSPIKTKYTPGKINKDTNRANQSIVTITKK